MEVYRVTEHVKSMINKMNKPRISEIAAISKNRALGKNNDLLFRIPDDLKRFKTITKGHPIIMGSKTFESLGSKPLHGRLNIVLSIEKNFKAPGAKLVFTPRDAIDVATATDTHEIFIVGGGQVYKLFLPQADRLYLTVVDKEVDADVYFPDYSEFKKVIYEEGREYEGLKYKFINLERE